MNWAEMKAVIDCETWGGVVRVEGMERKSSLIFYLHNFLPRCDLIPLLIIQFSHRSFNSCTWNVSEFLCRCWNCFGLVTAFLITAGLKFLCCHCFRERHPSGKKMPIKVLIGMWKNFPIYGSRFADDFPKKNLKAISRENLCGPGTGTRAFTCTNYWFIYC